MLKVNPYNSRDAVKDPADFKGQRELVAQVIRGLPNNYNIVGEPRAGKSSFLHFLSHPEEAFKILLMPQWERGLFLLIDLKRLPKCSDFIFWRYIFDNLTEKCRALDLETREMRMVYEKASATLEIYDIEQAMETYIGSLSKDVILLLDNFEVIVNDFSGEEALRTTGKLRSKNQHRIGNNRFSYIVTSNDPVYELFGKRGLPKVEWSSFSSSLDYKYLEPLDEESSLNLIDEPLRNFPDKSLIFTEDEKAWALKFAGTHPALLKRTCYHLFEAKEKGTIDYGKLREVIERDPHVHIHHLELLWERLEETESKTNLKLRDTLAALNAGAQVLDGAALGELIKRGIVTDVNYKPQITAGILIDFIQSQMGQVGQSPESHKAPGERKSPFIISKDEDQRTITFHGREISLTSLELKLFRHLAENMNRPCTREELARVLWAEMPPNTGGKDALEHIIRRVRMKIEDDHKNPRWILSIRKQGYLLHNEEPELSYSGAPGASFSYSG